jgi:hypothetical protein
MMNSTVTETSERISAPISTARRKTRPVDRKQAKDPMKLFPYLFQFTSPRLSQGDNSATTLCEAPQNQQGTRYSLFVAFRSPSDQQCVIAVPSCRTYDRSEAHFQHWIH